MRPKPAPGYQLITMSQTLVLDDDGTYLGVYTVEKGRRFRCARHDPDRGLVAVGDFGSRGEALAALTAAHAAPDTEGGPDEG